MKRTIPLYIIDTSRAHKRGECDYIVCTDKENGFIARCEFLDGRAEEAGDDYRIRTFQGVSVRITVERYLVDEPDKAKVRTLLKGAEKYYLSLSQFRVDINSMPIEECIKGLYSIARSFRTQADRHTGDYEERVTLLCAEATLMKSKEYLEKSISKQKL